MNPLNAYKIHDAFFFILQLKENDFEDLPEN